MKKIAVIGGGPSGVFFAIKILQKNQNVDITIFDKSSLLSTILPTGNGRCNLTYNEFNPLELSKFYPRGEKQLISAFTKYNPYDAIEDFKKLGIETYVQDDNRIFPKSNSSSFVRKKMLECISNKVTIIKKEINEIPNNFDYIILATGLKHGANLAKSLGHTIIPIKKALVGLQIKEKEFLILEGVSFNDTIFTKNGVSGPFIYKLSSINAYKSFPYEIKIPLINPIELEEKVKENPKKLFKNVVSDFLPKSLAKVLIKENKNCANTTKKEIYSLENLILTATNTDEKGEIVHAGGVDLSEIDKNYKSKKYDNVWIIGELLNIDGFTGGFNLQNCWTSASISAENVLKLL